MHKLFTVDHLIHEIFSHVRRSDLPRLARVCSTWFRCSISRLYRNAEMDKVLALLGKITEKNTGLMFVNPPISDAGFERFLKYSLYVQTILMDSGFISIVLEASRTSLLKQFPYLFPNLRTLVWTSLDNSQACSEISISLISPKIEHLSLQITDLRVLRFICSLMMSRFSVLHSLSIEWDTSKASGVSRDAKQTHLVKPIQRLFTRFKHTLTSVHVSASLNTSIYECFAKLPNLRDLTIGEFTTAIQSPRTGEELEKSEIRGDAENFSSLSTLSFKGHHQSFYDMFVNPNGLAPLTKLTYNVKLAPEDVGMIISFIVIAFPHIRSLSLGGTSSPGERQPIGTDTAWPVIPWVCIQPISRCKNLHSLSLDHMRISVSPEELTTFLKSRTSASTCQWTRLNILTVDPLHPQDILLYAQHCPNLKRLGVHLDKIVGFSVENLPNDMPTFPYLNQIDLFCDGEITKPSSRLLAEFFYRVCEKRLLEYGRLDLSVDYVPECLADIYIQEERKTGKSMSREVKICKSFEGV